MESIWECEFKSQIAENDELKQFLATLQLSDPLCPRDAFFGGRTNATVLYYEVKGDEMIKYADINSLYPHVNKTGKSILNKSFHKNFFEFLMEFPEFSFKVGILTILVKVNGMHSITEAR